MVVLRTYRVRVEPTKLSVYEKFEREEGVPMVAAQEGCLACGFGRVREAKDRRYVFYSLWESQAHLDRARASPVWKQVASKLEKQGLTLAPDESEHLDVLGHFAFQAGRPPTVH